MKVGIIQLSDIHFKEGKNLVVDYKDAFQRASIAYLRDCVKIIIVISGDVAFSGNKKEYEIAYSFLKDFEKFIKKEGTWINSIDYVIVPGNHDCDFSGDEDIRKLVINQVSTEDELTKQSYIEQGLTPQSNFWEFYNRLIGINPSSFISYQVEIPLLIDKKIVFHCYNTSFLSQIDEKEGSLIVPTNYYLHKDINHQNIVISVFHHNPAWLSTKTPKNNKKLFESHLIKESDIVMCGHEHTAQHFEVSAIESSDQIEYLESSAFQANGKSSFNIIEFDTDTNKLANVNFSLDNKKNLYVDSEESEVNLIEKIKGITLRNEFADKLNSIDIPLKHSAKADLRLTDIYVYPDLEPLVDMDTKVIQYTDSSILSTDKETSNVIFIEGDNQSGKTSLIKMTFLSLIQKSVFPLLVKGKDISHTKIDHLIKSSYKEQYINRDYSFNEYKQLNIDKKVLFIEDLDECDLNRDGIHALLEELKKQFGRIIITISPSFKNEPFLVNLGNGDIKYYHLKSLGYEKRNQLIEKWFYIGKDRYTVNHVEVERQVKLTFDQISSLLGEEYIPSYPVFILSLLQSLNSSLKNFDVEKTSYGYCYYSLIIAALIKNGVTQDKVEGIIQFLSKLAFSMYEKSRDSFSNVEYNNFYTVYVKSYRASYGVEKLLEILTKSYIIKDDDGSYKFSYKYIFYYLIAASISRIQDSEKLKAIIKELCDNMHREKEANILIFLANQNIIPGVIQELIFYSWLPFEDYKPITLETNDRLFSQIKNIAKEIKVDVMRNDVNPHEERAKELKQRDRIKQEAGDSPFVSDEEIDKNKDLRDVSSSIKIVRILGQIIKNQKYTYKIEKLETLVEQAYNVSFRTIAFLSDAMGKSKEEIVDYLKKKHKNITKEDTAKIEDRVSKILQSMLYKFCLDNFSNVSASVGAPDMIDLFTKVANDMNTPAARIVSFTINTYYNKMNISDLEDIMQEFRNNPVATEIIRSRVISYVYHNYVSRDERQKIGNICKFRLVDKNGYKQYIIEKFTHGKKEG